MFRVTVPMWLNYGFQTVLLRAPQDFVKVFPGVPGTVWGGSHIFNPHFKQSSARMICFMYLLPCKSSLKCYTEKEKKGVILWKTIYSKTYSVNEES